MAHKLTVLARHCDDVGRDAGEISVSTQALIALDGMRLTDPPYGRFSIGGSATAVVERLGQFRDLGVGEFIVPEFNWGGTLAERMENADRFMEEVASHLS